MNFEKAVKNLDEMNIIAAEIASILNEFGDEGCIVVINGEMGAGKTTLVSFLVNKLRPSLNAKPSSPTFTIINEYASDMYHVDLYRITKAAALGVGLDEILDGNNIVFVEWASIMGEEYWQGFEQRMITINIEKVGEDGRVISVTKGSNK